jgi:hypothetical protein
LNTFGGICEADGGEYGTNPSLDNCGGSDYYKVASRTASFTAVVQTKSRFFHQSTDCVSCVKGQYDDQGGQGICKTCIAGRYANQIGRTNVSDCLECPKGWWIAANGNPLCTACVEGKWQNILAQTTDTCKSCVSGKYNTLRNSVDVSACVDCAKGKYMLTAHTAVPKEYYCKQCEVSKYSDETATTATCKRCVAGTYGDAVLLTAVTQCKSCTTGRYDTRTGLSSVDHCKRCPVGQHQAVARQTSCENCATAKFADVVELVSDCQFWLSCLDSVLAWYLFVVAFLIFSTHFLPYY